MRYLKDVSSFPFSCSEPGRVNILAREGINLCVGLHSSLPDQKVFVEPSGPSSVLSITSRDPISFSQPFHSPFSKSVKSSRFFIFVSPVAGAFDPARGAGH